MWKGNAIYTRERVLPFLFCCLFVMYYFEYWSMIHPTVIIEQALRKSPDTFAPDSMQASNHGKLNSEKELPQNDEEYHKALWSNWNNGYHPDKRFAALLKLFQQKANGSLKPNITKFRSGSIPRVLIWAQPFRKGFWDSQMRHIREGVCPLPCKVTYDINERKTVDAIMFSLRGTKDRQTVMDNLSPRDPHQPWIMFSMESPPLSNSIYSTPFELYNGLFNRTFYYHVDSDITYFNGFVIPKTDQYTKLLPRSWILPAPSVQSQNSTRVKKLAVAFISNCGAQSKRLQYIKKMQKYGPVDIYGECGTLKCGHRMYVEHQYNVSTDKCLREAGTNYLFYLAFENNLCDDYITEKVFNLMYYPIVPVLRSQTDFKKTLPPNSYIDASKYSPKELMEKMLYLKNNPEEYQKLLEWRNHYQMSTMGGDSCTCFLCSRLYDPDIYEHKVIEDFEDWFVGKSHCTTPMLK